ncbi:MAG TPA: hypothetical protein VGK34_03220 [Armatimonadota bacterium]|jgi:hypothetical protein
MLWGFNVSSDILGVAGSIAFVTAMMCTVSLTACTVFMELLGRYMKKNKTEKWREICSIGVYIGKDSYAFLRYIYSDADNSDATVCRFRTRIKKCLRFSGKVAKVFLGSVIVFVIVALIFPP